jgi:hypothetical protein
MADVDAIMQSMMELDEEELTARLGMLKQSIEADPSQGDLEALEESIAVPRASWEALVIDGMNQNDFISLSG